MGLGLGAKARIRVLDRSPVGKDSIIRVGLTRSGTRSMETGFGLGWTWRRWAGLGFGLGWTWRWWAGLGFGLGWTWCRGAGLGAGS